MFKVLFLFSVVYISFAFATCQNCDFAEDILRGKIYPDNFRYKTFTYALQLMRDRNVSMVVETGTARDGLRECASNGCSTIIFAEWIKLFGGEFYSVDINAQHLLNVSEALKDLNPLVNLIHSDSVPFLQDFNKTIDFLYLDSFDFDLNDPTPSQEHHLKEIIAAYPWLVSKSIVMVDDCDLPYGGKGKLVIEYLLNRGWKILAQGYQVILSQE